MTEERGILPIVAVVIIAMVGSGFALPVAVSYADVRPDHRLYFLKERGEWIRRLNDFQKMKIRWKEFTIMAKENKGLEYEKIYDKFWNIYCKISNENKVIQWITEKENELIDIQFYLLIEVVKDNKELVNIVENKWMEIRPYCQNTEDVMAFVEYLKDNLKIVNVKYLRMENKLDNLYTRRWAMMENNWNVMLEMFDNYKNEVENLLVTVPNVPLKFTALRLYNLALIEKNIAVNENIFGQLVSAVRHMIIAKTLLFKADVIDEQNRQMWENWRKNIKNENC
jgi:hypothetical protein